MCAATRAKSFASRAGYHALRRPPTSNTYQGRGFHSLKRRYATEARHTPGFDKQAGTTKATLELRYVQDDKLDEKRAVAELLHELCQNDENA